MKRNTFLHRLNPLARRTAASTNRRRGPYSPRRLAFEGLETRTLLAVFTVTSTLDTVDADDGETTLREAIIAANADEITDTIHFNINGGGAQTITLGEALPSIIETVIIDGSTQPADLNGTSLITIDASAVTSWVVMDVRGGAGGSTLSNFQISNVPETALSLGGDGGGNLVENLKLSGHNAVTWMSGGLWITSDGNTIQGTTVSVSGSAISIIGANENTVDSCDLNNSNEGVHLGGDSNDNQILNNNASNNLVGVSLYLVTGTGNRIIDNDFSNTGTGIGADYADDMELADHIEEMLVVRDNVFTMTGTAVKFVGLHDIDLVASPDFDIDVREARYGLILSNASNVTIDGFDLSGDGTRTAEFDRGLGLWGTTNTNITIRNIISQNRHTGIEAQGLINSEISNADLSWTTPPPPGGRISYGLSMTAGSNNNTVHDVTFENQFVGIYLSGTSNVTAYCNRIVNNVVGVAVAGDATTNLTLHSNQIEGNTQDGIQNYSGSTVNAKYNYWGADDGPSNLGGGGDSYWGDVDAYPFLTEIPPCIDNTPPEILGVDVSTNLSALIVQLNDDDLHPTLAQNADNYKLTAAGVDGVFGTADDRDVAIDSIVYDAVTDVITLQTSEPLFDEVFRLNIDGDGIDDGTPGVADLSGNFLSGGDFTSVLDMTTISLIEDTLTKLEEMGLSTGTENSLVGKLEAAVKVLGAEANGNGVLALMDAFQRGVLHWFDRGRLTADQRDELLADTDLIILGITLTAA